MSSTPDGLSATPGAARGDPAALAALIVRSATDFAIVTCDANGVITSWSPGAEAVMGWTGLEAVGRHVGLFFTPEDVAAGLPALEMSRAREDGFATDERWHLKRDGARFWASGELQPLAENDEAVGFVKILRDRTEHVAMQEQLAAAQREAATANERQAADGRRLQEMFAAAPGFIAVLRGPDHVFDYANASYDRLVGYRPLIGRPVREALPEVAVQGFCELLDRVYATGERVTAAERPIMLHGETGGQLEQHFINFVYEPMRDPAGAVVGIFVEGFDSTEVTLARTAADKASAEQSAILGQLSEGVIATDAGGRITFVNAAAEHLHGVARLDIGPDDYSDTYELLTEDGAPYPSIDLPLARAVVHGDVVRDARWRIRRPDGTEVLAIGNAQPVIVDGRQVGAVLTVRDDTERARADAAERETAERYRIATAATTDAVWDWDLTSNQVVWNDAVHTAFGYGAADVGPDGDWWVSRVHPDDRERVNAGIHAVIDGGVASWSDEYRFERADGSYADIFDRGAVVRDASGRATRMIGAMLDLTKRKAAEAALRAETDVLETLNRVFADVAGELDVERLVQRVTDAGREISGAEYGAFFYNRTAENGDMLLYTLSGADRSQFERFGMPRATAIFHPTLSGQSVMRSDDITQDPRYGLHAPHHGMPEGHLPMRSYLAVPVISRSGEPIGGLFFGHREPGRFNARHERLLVGVAGQAATAIDNARLFEAAQHEIAGRRRAQDALSASEVRYRTLFEAIDAGFCIVEIKLDETGRPEDYKFVEINPAFARQTGLEGATGQWARALVPDLEQHWVDMYGEVAVRGKPMRFENGSEALGRWFDVYAFPVGEPGSLQVALLFNDISDRRNAEIALCTLNETLEARVAAAVAERDLIWRTSPDLFVICGFDGVYHSVNPAWTTLLGYGTEELVGSRFDALVHPEDLRDTVGAFEMLVNGEPMKGLDLRLRAKDGSYRWTSWTAVPQGNLFSAAGRDITARKELEEQLRQSQKMEAVGQLTGGIAHDFNNLLTIVSGNIEMAKRTLGPEGNARALRSLGNAAKGADRAAALTQRLLAFSRRQPLQPRETDVNKLITGMTELLDRALGETVDLQVVTGAGLWRVEVDPNQLENAILNLAVNARDAMPGGGKLTIETNNTAIDEAYAAAQREVVPGQYVLVSVTDTGEGMSPDIVAKAFDPFFSTKDVGKGTGLGLSQVYGYVKQSGGHVKIYSEAGLGTTIKIYLPCLVAAMNNAEEVVADTAPAMQGMESILVVEDDDDVRIYTVDTLRELGYRVLEAHDGASALRLLERQEQAPALLLTDVVMPGMSGRELADKARTTWPDMRVLFTTGYARNAIVHGGRLDRGVELLPKPFTYDALAAKIREVLEKSGNGRAMILDPSDSGRAIAMAALAKLGLEAEPAADVREALGKLRAAAGRFDVILLSDAVPVDNLDAVIAELHAVRSDLPILVVSSNKTGRLARLHADRPCIAVIAAEAIASDLEKHLAELRVKCANAL